MIELERGSAKWEFCPLPVRTFRTLRWMCLMHLIRKRLVKAIEKKDIQMRLIYKLRSEQMEQLDSASLHRALSAAHSYQPELVSQLARPRLPELGASNSIAPIEALKPT